MATVHLQRLLSAEVLPAQAAPTTVAVAAQGLMEAVVTHPVHLEAEAVRPAVAAEAPVHPVAEVEEEDKPI